jgi:hypothetical protein
LTRFIGSRKSISKPPTPVVFVSIIGSNGNEGDLIGFTVLTTGISTATQLTWTINNVTTSSADFVATSGTFYVSAGGTATFYIGLVSDNTTEGSESYTVTVSGGGASSLTSSAYTISDTSVSASATGSQQAYTTPGTYSWVCPTGVTSVSVVCVGAGGTAGAYGGSAGSLAYKNNIAVTAGVSYTVVVGATNTQNFVSPYSFPAGNSSFGSTTPVRADGGVGGYSGSSTSSPSIGSGYDGGGQGGAGCSDVNLNGYKSGAGGGAGGYTGNGGSASSASLNAGQNGSGGGGGAGSLGGTRLSGGGGGVGILGQGVSGIGGAATFGTTGYAGKGGSSGEDGGSPSVYFGGLYGGGSGAFGSGTPTTEGKNGAVRIIWATTGTRAFPSTNTLDL